MPDFGLALALHVLAVVLWIGGVAMVTTIILPVVRRVPRGPEPLALFDAFERRFARQARGTSLVAGVTGFYMTHRLGLWRDLLTPSFWWLDAMLLVWLLFTVLLFIAEPLFLHRWLTARARRMPEATLALIQRLHWALLALSLLAIFAGVLGAHGLSLFG